MRRVVTLMAAALLLALAVPGMGQQAPDQFKDVEPNHWAYQAMETLRGKGIVIGYPDGYFRGRRTLTRYEFAVALDRALAKIGPGAKGDAGEKGEAGAKGDAGEAGPAGAAGAPADPAEVDALKKLAKEFKDELASLGNSVNAIGAKLDGLAKDVAGIKDTLAKLPVISGAAYFGVRSDRASGNYLDRNNVFHLPDASTPLLRDAQVVHELMLGVDAKLAGGATLAARASVGNYVLSTVTGFGPNYNGQYPYSSPTPEDVSIDLLEVKAPLQGIGRDGSLSVGRLSLSGAKYVLACPDFDVYFSNPQFDDGAYRGDGLRYTGKFGSMDVDLFGVQTKPVQGTGGLKCVPEAGHTYPGMGVTAIDIDQMVGLSGKLPVRLLGGGYLRLSALGATNNTADDPAFASMLVLGADASIKLSDRVQLDVEWAKSILGSPSFRTVDGGASHNRAIDASVTVNAGALALSGGYSDIGANYYGPGSWGRIGPWVNPVGMRGPKAGLELDLGKGLGASVSGSLLEMPGVSMGPRTNFKVSDLKAGVHYDLTKRAKATIGWERLEIGYNASSGGTSGGTTAGGASRIHPRLNYLTLGTDFLLASSTTLKCAYEIADFNDAGTGWMGGRSNYNTLTTQVAVKF